MMHTDSGQRTQKDIDDFPRPLVTVDAAIFTFSGEQLLVLLTQRSENPFKDRWALPGGFVDEMKDTTLDETVNRKLYEKTGVYAQHLEQLLSVGGNKRDPRGWSVTVAYTALIRHQECETHVANVSDVQWVDCDEAMRMELAFDHSDILIAAKERLKQKALYSIIPVYALPNEFTLPELQRVHEILIGKPLQKKSFRRRIEQAELLEEVGMRAPKGKGRPSSIYRVKADAKDFTFLRNLEQ